MAKKKKTKKADNKSVWIFVALAFLFGMGGYMAATGSSSADYASKVVKNDNGYNTIPTTGVEGLIETRPILSPEYFKGRTALTYQYASKIPQTFDALYCHCKCKENLRFMHKNLLTCYTDGHAAQCGICMKEGHMAMDMHKAGKSNTDIQTAIDAYYDKPGGGRRFF